MNDYKEDDLESAASMLLQPGATTYATAVVPYDGETDNFECTICERQTDEPATLFFCQGCGCNVRKLYCSLPCAMSKHERLRGSRAHPPSLAPYIPADCTKAQADGSKRWVELVKDILYIRDMGTAVPWIAKGLGAIGVGLVSDGLQPISTAAVARSSTSSGLHLFKGLLLCSAITSGSIALGVVGIEVSIHAYHWYKGDITKSDFVKLSIESLATNGAIFVSSWAGAAAGAALGAPLGPAGAVVGGILGSIVAALLTGTLAYLGRKKFQQKYVEFVEARKKEELVKSALETFLFNSDFVHDRSRLTLRDIKVKYNELVRLCHPDRGGNHDAFIQLHMAYGILLEWVQNGDVTTEEPGAKYVGVLQNGEESLHYDALDDMEDDES